MANLDNLISKILEDANNKAQEIINEAKEKEKEAVDSLISKAEKQKELIINKSHIESVTRKERIISNANLDIRNKKLKAKQDLIESIFNKAENELQEISQDEYNKFVRNFILSMDVDGDEEIVISRNYKNAIDENLINFINGELRTKGKKGELKLSSEDRDINGGFILCKNGIEINCTFEALVPSLRDELEDKILDILFKSN